MTTRFLAPSLLFAVCSLPASAQELPALPAPQVSNPSGEYQTALLQLEQAWEGGTDLPVFLGFRNGQGTAAWLVGRERKDAHRLWIDENSVRIANGKLSGEIAGRMVKVWAPIAETGNYSLQLTAVVDGTNVAGSYSGNFGKSVVSGKLSGTLSTDALQKQNSLPAEANWPTYNSRDSSQTLLNDDLQQARPRWKAEEPLPCMWGRGPEDRYPQRACMTGCDGGASSPVVADSRVFVYYFRPSGKIGSAPLSFGAGAPKVASEADAVEFAKKHSQSPYAHQSMVDWYRPFADDIVVAFDAATGKTLWKTELNDRSGNHQAHKWRGMNPTPTIVGNKIFVQGYGGRLYALNTTSGKLLWEYGGVATKLIRSGGVPKGMGPIVSGNVVVFAAGNNTIGVDLNTGRELWKTPGANPLLWRTADGVERLIVFGSEKLPLDKIDCLEVASGQRVWSAPVASYSGMGASITGGMALIAGDLLVGFSPAKDPTAKPTGGVPHAWKLSATGATKAWEGEFLPSDENVPVTLAGDRVYVQGREEIRAYELATGRLVAKIAGKDSFTGLHGPGSNPWLTVVGNRVLLNPEGQHGGQRFLLLDTDLKPLSAWQPPHATDSAYGCMAVASPVVAGRVFIRGHDGLYCYDLRN